MEDLFYLQINDFQIIVHVQTLKKKSNNHSNNKQNK